METNQWPEREIVKQQNLSESLRESRIEPVVSLWEIAEIIKDVFGEEVDLLIKEIKKGK